jgi:uncharacterized membrane protein
VSSSPAPSGARLPTWYRGFAAVIGLISIALAFVVLIFPALGLLTLVFLLAFALLIIGIDRLVAGITGHPFGYFAMGPGGPFQKPPSSPPGPPPIQ